MTFQSIEEIQTYCQDEGIPFWEAVQREDAKERGVTVQDSWEKMEGLWQTMRESLSRYEPDRVSLSGLVGTEGALMQAYAEKGDTLCGDFPAKVMANALKMGCNNACMQRIVAAPTAGSCGVLPAVLVTWFDERKALESQMIEALYVAAGIGQVIDARACLAGAAGGCQAEIGAAAGMAAAAICCVKGGSDAQIGHACALALKNLMGLVCDPVAGLVEVPCVKRNAGGAMIALSAADMALAGIESRVPPDQVIDAMKDVGDRMDGSLKETGAGGVAASPWAVRFTENLRF